MGARARAWRGNVALAAPSRCAPAGVTRRPQARAAGRTWNSLDGIWIVVLYSCSGMPRCSESMSISFISKSEMRLLSSASNIIVSVSPSSSDLSVTTSSLPMHLRIFDMLARFSPSDTPRSHRKWSNMSERRLSEQSETCDESIACK
jgi:hypothetical protein